MATTAEVKPRELATTNQQVNTRKLVGRITTYALLVLLALIFLVPLFWMVSTSLKPKSQLFSAQIYWIPKTLTLKNYTDLLSNTATPVGRWFVNSLGVAHSSDSADPRRGLPGRLRLCPHGLPGRNVLFALLLATLFLPGMMFLIPNFLTIYHLGLLNNYLGVIIPALAGVFGVFFLRQFFESIPKDLEEAAVIDGANRFQTFYMIALPLSRPALATLGVITFLASWNDFLWPLLILQKPELLTLPPGLRTLQGAYTSEYGQMMAGAVIAAVPVLILYILLQRFIVQSVATTGLKG